MRTALGNDQSLSFSFDFHLEEVKTFINALKIYMKELDDEVTDNEVIDDHIDIIDAPPPSKQQGQR